MSELAYVKYCPLCGAENPRQQAFCRACLDGDLSTVPAEPRRLAAPPAAPTPAPAEVAAPPAGGHCVLELMENPAVRFTVGEGQTVGRTGKADVVLAEVPKSDWISGIHARFFHRHDQWYVQHLGQTNFIKVDGAIYRGNEEVALYDGSILVLSLTPFRIRLEGDSA